MHNRHAAFKIPIEIPIILILLMTSIYLGYVLVKECEQAELRLERLRHDADVALVRQYPFDQYSIEKDIVLVKKEITTQKDTLTRKDTTKKGKKTVSVYEDEREDVQVKVAITKSQKNPKNKIEIHDDAEYEIKEKPKKEKKETPAGEKIAEYAVKLCSHDPLYNYKLGGRELSVEDNEGIDCAHFVGHIYRKLGFDVKEGINDANVVTIRKTMSDYMAKEYSKKDPVKLDEMKAGDIIIFFNNGHDSHTAIYIGDGKIAHAASTEMGVTITDMDYDEKTGIAGYNGKTVQCVIRRAVDDEVKKEEEPESDEKNIIVTEINMTKPDQTPITSTDISVIVNDEEVPLYTVDKVFSDPYVDVTKKVNIDDSNITITLQRDEEKAVITTVSDKEMNCTVKPVLRKVTRDMLLNTIQNSENNAKNNQNIK